MIYKGIISFILTLTLILCAGCMQSYNVEKDLSPEKITEYQQEITENEEILASPDLNEVEKKEALQTLGIAHDRLGNYDQSISYYQQVLEIDPLDYVSLNNLASIYEEVEQYALAAEYIVRLYPNYKDSQEVVRDTIRILVKNQGFEDAQMVLNEYASTHPQQENSFFISDQFEYIARMSKKAEESK